MPARNSIKQYEGNAYYHLYNRGVEKRSIFLDEQDYSVFLLYLKTYLLPKDEKLLRDRLVNPVSTAREKNEALKLLRLNNFADTINLLSYCLMPNHFHLLLYQKEPHAIDQFMNSLGSRYSGYFNRKYKRVGSLFQGVYKAVRVYSEEQLLHLTRYIHRNPLKGFLTEGLALKDLYKYSMSSYQDYIGSRENQWVQTQSILSFFHKDSPRKSYQDFVEARSEAEPTIPSRILFDI